MALWRHPDTQNRTIWSFWAIFCRFLPLWPSKWKLSHKTMVEIVHSTKEISLKQFFFQKLPYFGPMTSSWHPNRIFLAFWAIFCIFLPFWPQHGNYPKKSWWRLFTILRKLVWNNFLKNVTLFWPCNVILTQKLHFLGILSKFCWLPPFWPPYYGNYPIKP